METVELILILIGVAFVISSFFIEEKLSHKEVEQIAQLSEKELQILVEKQVNAAKIQIENAVEESFDEALEITHRGLEKTTNEKIMAVSEYSDTILESMNATHNEIMFLYSMLNDKHVELTELAGSIQQLSKSAQKKKSSVIQPVIEEVDEMDDIEVVEPVVKKTKRTTKKTTTATKVEETPVTETKAPRKRTKKAVEKKEEISETAHVNQNEQILNLHKEGKSNIEIAKILGCGLGEIKLVLGLFKEEQ